ncbi:MAG TPA: cupredoxin domain-containing protein [Patescibacteria group bacterium]|nr:cupredoxin domain-containing protein [Patescibacteria group bacterium]
MEEENNKEVQDEETPVTPETTTESSGDDSKGSKNMLVAMIFIALIALVGVYYFFFMNKPKSQTTALPTPVARTQPESTTTGSGNVEGTSTGNQVIETPSAANETVKEIVVKGSNFKFDPKTFEVKAGEKIKLVFKNSGGIHDLTFDDLAIATKQISTDQESVVEFTAPAKAGEYTFYCSVGNHRAMGMEGVMVVK